SPPSVSELLVDEDGPRAAGVPKYAVVERFMFRYMPDMFKGDFAETEAEADAWVKGERKKNRRPPELLTRDVVAKAITREIAEGRGSPHGASFSTSPRSRLPTTSSKSSRACTTSSRSSPRSTLPKNPWRSGRRPIT